MANPTPAQEKELRDAFNLFDSNRSANVESDNYVILENVLGKLTQSSAGLSFNNNEYNFKKCSDLEIALRQRYFSITRIRKKKL
ncbi:unnamed protein product [Rotaria sordida]|uniref:EF-hand domain-containing protein n=1 Tax=Rotaria sordida TaxID=392033 RepID=A0A813TP98_9BILA|nr:unnamed protein product [Rotaria sordida]